MYLTVSNLPFDTVPRNFWVQPNTVPIHPFD